nr:hypothetical protein [Geobacillus thermoleovorans]
MDDWIEGYVNYAFDERLGYLTSCPTNVGRRIAGFVMMHLPALVLTQQINRIIPAINQLGLVVRGTYGEGSEALGIYSKFPTRSRLGNRRRDIVADLHTIVQQLIAKKERLVRH